MKGVRGVDEKRACCRTIGGLAPVDVVFSLRFKTVVDTQKIRRKGLIFCSKLKNSLSQLAAGFGRNNGGGEAVFFTAQRSSFPIKLIFSVHVQFHQNRPVNKDHEKNRYTHSPTVAQHCDTTRENVPTNTRKQVPVFQFSSFQ